MGALESVNAGEAPDLEVDATVEKTGSLPSSFDSIIWSMTYVQDGAEYYDVEDVEWRDGDPTLIASVRRDFECSEQRFLCQCGHTWPVPAQVDVDVL